MEHQVKESEEHFENERTKKFVAKYQLKLKKAALVTYIMEKATSEEIDRLLHTLNNK